MRYRDKNEIIAQILEIANNKRVQLTKIMHDAYLPYAMTKEYMTDLIEKGLMEYLDGERSFKTTEKGTYFLSLLSRVQELGPLTTKSRRTRPPTIKEFWKL